ncbi:MAG: GGDEF-domain containing protein [Proteobacteria bacterium]|nr:MAG: GGDEF-domain containing protein [Pseudomonadota bacterium]
MNRLGILDVIESQTLLLLAVVAILLVLGIFLYRYYQCRKDSQLGTDSPRTLATKEEVLKMVPHPVVLLTGQYVVMYFNPSAEKLFNSPLRRNLGRPANGLFELLDPKTKLPIKGYLPFNGAENPVNQPKSIQCIVRYQESINAWMNVTVQALLLHDNPSKSQYVVFLEDISATRAVESQLTYMECHDSQTGLLNRKAFEAALNASIDDARKHGSSHVFVTLSIDQFKTINDTVGYAAGDSLIGKVVSALKKMVSGEGENIGGRLGGNDFGILFKESTLFSAANKMRIIRDEISSSQFSWNTRAFPITLSGGFVVIKRDTSSAARVLTESDIACRTARNHGGNRVIAYRAESAEMRQEQSNMEGVWRLKKAFKNNSFELFAQPIHPLKEGEFSKPFHHYELLVRMHGEDGNSVSPDQFIPVAEYYSMMPELDRWVVREALRHISKIEPSDHPPVFAINLSGQSLDEANFRDYVLDELRRTGADARMICFEITEAVAVNDLALATRFISTLKAEGSSFSLDDFGTGVSSYGYLTSLDVDYLKIDGIFVKDLIRDSIARNIVESVTQVGHAMGLKIIAEYVEDDNIIALLRKMGVDYGQGYGIGKPKPLSEAIVPHLPV